MLHEAGEGQGNHDPGADPRQDQQHDILEGLQDNASAPRSQGQPDANLSGALLHQVGDKPEHADSRKQQGCSGDEAEQDKTSALRPGRFVDKLIE